MEGYETERCVLKGRYGSFCGITCCGSCAVFTDAVLDGCRLEDAVFANSSFQGALLWSCQVRRADFTGCRMEGAKFVDTPMEEAENGKQRHGEQDGGEAPAPALFL